jgi:hypothetical protein
MGSPGRYPGVLELSDFSAATGINQFRNELLHAASPMEISKKTAPPAMQAGGAVERAQL